MSDQENTQSADFVEIAETDDSFLVHEPGEAQVACQVAHSQSNIENIYCHVGARLDKRSRTT